MKRLDHHALWRRVRSSLAEVPLPLREALGSDNNIERTNARDRLASFISSELRCLEIMVHDFEEEEPDAGTPLFPDLREPSEEEETSMPDTDVIEKHECFGRWLLAQRLREDAIGALAKQAWRDPAFPKDGGAKDVSKHLNARGADPDTHEALETAELDWLAL